jgi:hypothetical protein
MNDLRVPIGVFFALVGALLLAVTGEHAPLTQAPVNLYSGVSMLAFGGVMLWLGLRRAAAKGRDSK